MDDFDDFLDQFEEYPDYCQECDEILDIEGYCNNSVCPSRFTGIEREMAETLQDAFKEIDNLRNQLFYNRELTGICQEYILIVERGNVAGKPFQPFAKWLKERKERKMAEQMNHSKQPPRDNHGQMPDDDHWYHDNPNY